jgi:hypothetical protein
MLRPALQLRRETGFVIADEIQVVYWLLNTEAPSGVEMTCIGAAAREARTLVGRDATSGELRDRSVASTWAGALVYLVLLEQLGSCFSPGRAGPPTRGGGIRDALEWFADVSTDDALAVKTLRDRFAHDYSLQGPHPRSRRFTVHDLSDQPLVGSIQDGYSISLVRLAEVAEKALAVVSDLVGAHDLRVHHQGGLERVVQRFTMVFINDQPKP